MIHSERPLILERIIGRGPMDMSEPFHKTHMEDMVMDIEEEVMDDKAMVKEESTCRTQGVNKETLRARPRGVVRR